LTIVILLYDAIYFQCSSPVFAMQAYGNICPKPGAYYTRKLLFPHQQQWKFSLHIIHSRILYERFYGTILSNCHCKQNVLSGIICS